MFTNRLGIELATQNAPPIKMKNLPTPRYLLSQIPYEILLYNSSKYPTTIGSMLTTIKTYT